MPALTHGRVGSKNGGKDFNGGRRLLNANAGIKFGRTIGATTADATRSDALVGGIGPRSKFVRRAINNRAITSKQGGCCHNMDKEFPKAILYYSSPGPYKNNSVNLTITAVFDKRMDSNFNVKIAISGVSTSISATNMTRVNSTTYTYLFTNNSFDNNGTNTIILSNGKDIVGNILNDVAKNNTFEVDNTAPTISSFTTTTVTGSYKSGEAIVIKANTSENIQSGNTITVKLNTNDTVLLTAAAAGRTLVGTYTVGTGDTSSGLTVSSFVINTVADTAGNAMTSTTLPTASSIFGSKTIVIDTTVPSVAITSSTLSNDPTPAVSGTAEAGATVSVVIAGATYSLTATGGNWSVDTGTATPASGTLSINTNGINSVSVTATDAVGNVSLAVTQQLVVDTTVPSVAITSSALSNDPTPTVSGTAEPGATVSAVIAGATYSLTATGGTWSVDTGTATPASGTLSINTNGSNSVSVTATDAATNVSSAVTQQLVVDTTVPSVAITSSALSNDPTPTVSGTAEPGATVSAVIAGATYSLTATGGTWSVDTGTATPASGTLSINTNGSNSVSVTATDAATNVSSAVNQTLVVDTTSPSILTALTVNALNTSATITFSEEVFKLDGTSLTIADLSINMVTPSTTTLSSYSVSTSDDTTFKFILTLLNATPNENIRLICTVYDSVKNSLIVSTTATLK